MELTITDEVLISLRRIIQAIDLHSRALVKRYGLTGPQLIILQEVAKKGVLSHGELSQAISVGQATVTGILMRLENKGFITRQRCETDKRKVLVQITEKGTQMIGSAPSPLQETFTDQFVKLQNWEKNMILSSLQRIVQMMDARAIDASPMLTTIPLETVPASKEEKYPDFDENGNSN